MDSFLSKPDDVSLIFAKNKYLYIYLENSFRMFFSYHQYSRCVRDCPHPINKLRITNDEFIELTMLIFKAVF